MNNVITTNAYKMKNRNSYTDAELNKWIDEAKGKKAPVVDDFFYARMKARMEEETKEPENSVLRFTYHFKIAATVVLFIVNSLLVTYAVYKSNTNQVSNQIESTEFEQEMNFEYTDIEQLAELN